MAERPKAIDPLDGFVTIRLSEKEIDILYRIASSRGISAYAREVMVDHLDYILRTVPVLPDSESARFARERRKARRAARDPQPELEAVVGEAISAHAEELQR